jgi:hypothetical protein
VKEALLDKVFYAIGGALAVFLLLFPNTFIYLASYGGRLKYKPSATMILITRACAALMLFGILRDVL